jgi:hypothetical protein
MIKLSEYIKLLVPLEERYGNQKKLKGIWYHGTSSKYLYSILSNGLVPHPKERVWDKNATVYNLGPYNLSLESYGGIYMTRRLQTAYSAAVNAANKTKTNPLLIAISITPKSLVLDEDTFSAFFIGYPQDILVPCYKIMVYGGTHAEKSELENERKKFTSDRLKKIQRTYNIKNENLIERLRVLISEEGFPATVARAASHTRDYLWRDAFYEYSKTNSKIPSKPSQEKCEKEYRLFIDKITKTLKFLLVSNALKKGSDNFSDLLSGDSMHGRSLQPIRFSGNNKIISIFEFKQSPTEQFGTDVHLKYGTVPDKFISDYNTISPGFNLGKIIVDKT